MTSPPPLELFQNFIPFGSVTCPSVPNKWSQMDFKVFSKFNLSGRIFQGLAKLQSIFRNNIYVNDTSYIFQSLSSRISERLPTIHRIAYLIRVCDFEKVELSYLHSIYHIRGSISQGNPTIYRKLRAFHFLHGLYLYF